MSEVATAGGLTHVDAAGHARMVDVSGKDVTARSACASGRVLLSAAAVAALRAGEVPKGDALAVARIAGIAGAKRTPDLIPLCHPIGLHAVTVDLAVTDEGVDITAHPHRGPDRGRDGGADLGRRGRPRADRHGEGHRPGRGDHRRAGGVEAGREVRALAAAVSEPEASERKPALRALAVTVSNRTAAGVYADKSGPVLVELLRSAGCEVVDGPLVIPDGDPVEAALRDAVAAGYDVVVTTGGTGLTPADLTPEMTRRVLAKEIPGIAEALRSAGAAAGVPAAILSRGVAGVADRTLIVNLPGSTGGVRDGMEVLAGVLQHAVSQIHGGDHARADGEAKR